MLNKMLLTDQAEGLRQLQKKHNTQVIAVTAGKGGVGKSNVSVNLALALANKQKRVMLFDGDLGLANLDVLLGLSARYNLSHVLNNQCEFKDIILNGPNGIKLVPSASGIEKMIGLDSLAYSGIVSAFNQVTDPLDYLIVDTAAGIAEDVSCFCRSAQEVVVVVCDEPTSITDAYALIKVLSKKNDIKRFHIIANMTREPFQGLKLFQKLYRVAELYLDVTLHYMGAIGYDELVHKAIKKQQGVITAYPSCLASRHIKKIADKISNWSASTSSVKQSAFFLERFIENRISETT